MDLERRPFRFSDGREIIVSESTWESSSIRSRIEERIRLDQASQNGNEDPVFFFFVKNFYSYLASCSSGNVPSAVEAYTLPDEDLDAWLEKVIEVNPESFVKVDRRQVGEISFRDGSRFQIVSSYLVSATMKRARLEEEGYQKEKDRENPKDILAVYLYPLLASCSIALSGKIPEIDELRSEWPEGEIYKWRDAVELVNPHLFGSTEEKEERALVEGQEIEKKRRKRRARSSRS